MSKIFKNFGVKQLACIMFAFILVIGITLTLSYTFSSNDVQVFNNLELNDQEIEKISLNDISIESESGVYTYKATLKANEDVELKYVRIIMKDSDNKEIVTWIGYVGNTLSKNEEKILEASTDADISTLNYIEYEVVK